MKEPIMTARLVCKHRAPTAGKYAEEDAKRFVGKFIKMAFNATNPRTGAATKEHMWVKVESESQGKLIGTLDNDPILTTDVQFGDEVTLTVDQIEDVIA